jgi:hypothetical protein
VYEQDGITIAAITPAEVSLRRTNVNRIKRQKRKAKKAAVEAAKLAVPMEINASNTAPH